MANKNIQYDINFNVDMSSLELLKESLNNIQHTPKSYFVKLNGAQGAISELNKIKSTASLVEMAVENAFNPKLNTFSFSQFNKTIQSAGLNMSSIGKQFGKVGDTGVTAFRNLSEQLLTTNIQAKKTKGFLSEIGTTFFNAAKWSIAYGAINAISNGIKSAWTYAVSLDSSLNDIRIVTGKTADEMDRFAKNANKAAKTLGTSTMDYTKGALIYYQQGLNDKDVLARTEVTAKAANVTGQSMQEVSEQLTAVWNGFKVVAEDSELYVDKLAAVAANSASDLEELSTAMSRVASTANALGINIDQLTAQISTIESITRQDAASIGTSLKTIYARMGDLAVGMEDEFGVTLGDVSGKLKKMGVDILDQSGNMREMGDVIEEVASKWGSWTEAQRQAAAVAIAGKRQYNNLFALFENWDMYQSNLSVSKNAEGTLQKQQDIYLESTVAKQEQLKTSAEGLKDAFFDNETLNKIYTAFSKILDIAEAFVSAIGGGGTLLLGVFSTLSTLLSGKIMQGFHNMISNLQTVKESAIELQAQDEIRQQFADSDDEVIQKMVELKKEQLRNAKYLNETEQETYNILIRQTNELAKQKKAIDDRISSVGESFGNGSVITREKNGRFGQKIDEDLIKNMSEEDKQIYIERTDRESRNLEMRQKSFSNINAITLRGAGKAGMSADVIQSGQKQLDSLVTLANDQLATGINKNTQAYKDLQAAMDVLNGTADNEGELMIENSDTREAAIVIIDKLKAAMNSEGDALRNLNEVLTSGAAQYANLTEEEKRALEAKEKLAEQAARNRIGEEAIQMVSSIGQLTMAFQSLTNIVDIVQDDTTNTWQKIQRVLMAIIAALPMVVMAVKAFRKMITIEAAALHANVTKALGWIGIILAAISLLITVLSMIKWPKSPLEQAEEDFDNMKTAADDLATALDNVKSEFEELEKSIEDYHDAQKAIDDLRVGTEEWAKAITEANTNILNLLDNYPALAKYISSDENGRLTISDEGLDYIKEQKQQEIGDTQAASYNAKREELEAQNKLLIEQNRKKNASTARNIFIQDYNNSHAIDYDSAKAWSVVGMNLTPIGAALGGTALATIESQINAPVKIIEDNMEAILKVFSDTAALQGKDNYEEQLRNSLLDVVGGNEQVVNALMQNKEELYKQSISLDENTRAQKLFNEQFVAEYYKDSEQRKSAQNQTLWDRIMAQTDSDMESRYTYDKESKNKENAIDAYKTNEGNKHQVTDKFREDFAKANGLSAKEAASLKLDGDNVVWNADDGSGQKTMAKKTAASLASSYNIARAKEDEINIRTNIANTMAGYGSLGYIAGGGAANIESATRAEASNYQKDLAKMFEEIQKTTGLGNEEILKKMVGEDSEYYKWFEANGKNIEDTLKFIAEAEQKKIEETIENMSKGMDATTAKSWNQFKDSSRSKAMTVEQNQNVANAMQKAFNVGGTTGLDIFSTMFNSNKLNIDQISELSKVINDLDFTDPTAQEQFAAALDDIGLSFEDLAKKTGVSTDRLIALFDETGDAANLLITKLDQFTDKIKAINELSGKFKIGEVFTKEEYESMIKMNYALKGYFIQYEDGFKVVKGTSEEVGEMLRKHFTVDDIKEQFQKVKDQATDLEKVFGTDTKATQQSVLDEFSNNVDDLDNYAELIKKYGNGTSLSAFKAAFATLADPNSTQEAKNDAKKTITQLADVFNQGISEKNLGNLEDQAAEESYISSMYTSLGALTKDKDKFTEETYKKMRESFLADYAQAFGLIESSFSELATTLGDSKAVKALQYLQDFENILSRISEQGKNLKGQDLANNITEQINKSSEALSSMKEIIKTTKAQLGIKGDLTYLTAYTQYLDALSKGTFAVDSDTDKLWKQLLEYLKEAEKTGNSIVDLATKEIDAIVQGVKDVEELRRNTYKFKKENQVNSFKYKTGFELGIEESITDRRETSETNMASYRNEAAAVSQGIRDIRKKINEAQTKEERAAYEAQLEDYEKQWCEIVSNFNNELKELNSLWKEGLEDIGDSFDTLRSKIETLNEVYKSTIEINKKLGISLGNNTVLRNSQFVNYGKIIQTRQQELEAYLKTLADLQAKGGDGTELYKENLEKIQTATKDTLNDLISYAELANDLFSEQLDELFENFNSTALTQKWDTSKKLDEALLDTVNSRFEVEKLRDKFNEAITNADSIKAQKELSKIMEQQLAILEEKDRLSQYEIDRANQLYELTLKQIALEESQRNTTKMRLVRDAAGNLTYAFTQDEDTSTKAQEEAAAAQNSLYNLDKNQIKTSIDNYNSLLNEMKSELVDATQLTGAARDERMRDIINSYAGLLKNEQSSLNEAYNNLIGDGYTLDSRLVDAIDSVLGEDIDKLTSDTEKQAKEYQDNIAEITSAIDQVKDVISQGIDIVDNDLKKDEKSIANNVATIVRELQKLSTGLQKKFDLVYPEENSQQTVGTIDDKDNRFDWTDDEQTRARLSTRHTLSNIGSGRPYLSNNARSGLSVDIPQMNLATPSFNGLFTPALTTTAANSNSVSYNINIGSVNSNNADELISSVQGLPGRAVQRSFSSRR